MRPLRSAYSLDSLVRLSVDTIDTCDQQHDPLRTADNTALCVSFKPNQAVYAAGDNAGYLSICDASKPGFCRVLSRLDSGRGAAVARVAWCREGAVALGTYTGGVRTVDVETQTRLYRGIGHAARVRALSWWAGPEVLLTAGGGAVQLHDVRLREAQSRPHLAFAAHHSALSPSPGSSRGALSAPPATANTAGLHAAVPVGECYVVTGGKDGKLMVWDIRNCSVPSLSLSCTPLGVTDSSTGRQHTPITALSLHEASGQLALVAAMSDVLVLPVHEVLYPSPVGREVQGRACSRGPMMHSSLPSCTGTVASWSHCGRHLAGEGPISSEGRGTLLLWDMDKSDTAPSSPSTLPALYPSHVLDGHASVLNDAAWQGVGEEVRLATACDDGKVRLYAPMSREVATYALAHTAVSCRHAARRQSSGQPTEAPTQGCRACWTQGTVYRGDCRTFAGAGDQSVPALGDNATDSSPAIQGIVSGTLRAGAVERVEGLLSPPFHSVPLAALLEACPRIASMGVLSSLSGLPSRAHPQWQQSVCALARGWSEECAWLYPKGYHEGMGPRHTAAWAKPWVQWSIAQGHISVTDAAGLLPGTEEGQGHKCTTPEGKPARNQVGYGPAWPWASAASRVLTHLPSHNRARVGLDSWRHAETPQPGAAAMRWGPSGEGTSVPRKRLFEAIS